MDLRLARPGIHLRRRRSKHSLAGAAAGGAALGVSRGVQPVPPARGGLPEPPHRVGPEGDGIFRRAADARGGRGESAARGGSGRGDVRPDRAGLPRREGTVSQLHELCADTGARRADPGTWPGSLPAR